MHLARAVTGKLTDTGEYMLGKWNDVLHRAFVCRTEKEFCAAVTISPTPLVTVYLVEFLG